jgi:hypothetical protein
MKKIDVLKKMKKQVYFNLLQTRLVIVVIVRAKNEAGSNPRLRNETVIPHT